MTIVHQQRKLRELNKTRMELAELSASFHDSSFQEWICIPAMSLIREASAAFALSLTVFARAYGPNVKSQQKFHQTTALAKNEANK